MSKILTEDKVQMINDSPEMERFNQALHQILQTPKSELTRLLAEEKEAKVGKTKPGPKPKTSSSAHA